MPHKDKRSAVKIFGRWTNPLEASTRWQLDCRYMRLCCSIALLSWNHCSQKVTALASTVHSWITAWDWNDTARNIETTSFSNVSNSSRQRGYFLQPANIMTFFVELKGRFPMHFLEELWHILYLHILDISVQHFPFVVKVTPSLMFSLLIVSCLQNHLKFYIMKK